MLTNNVAAVQPLPQYLSETSVSCSQATWHCSYKWQEDSNKTIFKDLNELSFVCNYKVFC